MRFGDELRPYWILLDIVDARLKVIVIAHEAVEIFAPPQAAVPLQDRIDQVRRRRLPTLDDVAKRMTLNLLGDDVDVIGHDVPRYKSISLAISVQEPGFDNCSALLLAQNACAVTSIERRFALRYRQMSHASRNCVCKTEYDVLN